MKKKLILIIMFFLGIIILMYPTISQYFNSKVQKEAIISYDEAISNIDEEESKKLFEEAQKYNEELASLNYPFVNYKKLRSPNEVFRVSNNGMMGYISIDKIKVKLPIYYGTSPKILNSAVGILEGSSLPIGGVGTHSVLSAHRGLPSSKLFTDLNILEIGDIFTITILDRTITYQIDSTLIVKPNEIDNLKIDKEQDYVTLMTCTPYGINTHRLLIRGKHIENVDSKEINITSDAYQVNKIIVSGAIIVPILVILYLILLFKPSKKSKMEVKNEKENI